MTDAPSKKELRDKSEQLNLVAAELDREISSQIQRANAMEQRATILIGAASVVGALQISTDFSWTTISNLALSFLAAVAGVVVVFPRKGDALDVRPVRDDLLKMGLLEGTYQLIDTKLEILEADEKWLSARGWIARAGFIALALSIAVALLGALTPPSPAPDTQTVVTAATW